MAQSQKQKADRAREPAAKTRRPGPASQGPEALLEGPDLLAFQRALADPGTAPPGGILALQKTAGNRAVQRFVVQRQAPEEEEDLQLKTIQRQPSEEEEALAMKPIQRVGAEGGPVPRDVESAINRARGSGQPLESGLQAQMGETMGYDFSELRVHTGPESDELNHWLSARAFTIGSDIFFRQGEYNPGSSSGRELVAHEMTHVVQQSSGRVSGDVGGMTVMPVGDAFEQEADVAVRNVWSQPSTNGATGNSGIAVSRRGGAIELLAKSAVAQVDNERNAHPPTNVIGRGCHGGVGGAGQRAGAVQRSAAEKMRGQSWKHDGPIIWTRGIWPPAGTPTSLEQKKEFGQWLFKNKPEPTSMNCWEAVVFAHFKDGKDKDWVKGQVSGSPKPALLNSLQATGKTAAEVEEVSIAEDTVIAFGEGDHVVLATGKTSEGSPEVLSLDSKYKKVEPEPLKGPPEKYRRLKLLMGKLT